MSDCPSVSLSTFYIFIYWANFSQALHKSFLVGGDSILFKWEAQPFSKGRQNISKLLRQNFEIFFSRLFCLFVWDFFPHYFRWRAAKFDLCSSFIAIQQWGFFSVPQLLWHEPSVYYGHLRGPVILTPSYCRAFGSEAVTTFHLDLCLLRLGFHHPTFRMRE